MKVKDIKVMIDGKSDDEEIREIINRNDYVAMKLWTKEDIAAILEEEGYATTEENIDTVLSYMNVDWLEDADDGDWNIIKNAISNAWNDLEV